MDKADDAAAEVGNDRPEVGLWPRKTCGPHIPSIVEYLTVQECIGIGTAIVPAPTIGVEGGDVLGVVDGGTADPHGPAGHDHLT
ncbi:MAG: hypothetical protein ABSC41_03870 [Acidimicrobiales bacterium]